MFRIDTSYNKRFFTWTTSTGMNNYYSKNNQVEEVTKILGTNLLGLYYQLYSGEEWTISILGGTTEIIENTSSGTKYFAKVTRNLRRIVKNIFMFSCPGTSLTRCSFHLQRWTGCNLLLLQCGSSVPIIQQWKLEKFRDEHKRSCC